MIIKQSNLGTFSNRKLNQHQSMQVLLKVQLPHKTTEIHWKSIRQNQYQHSLNDPWEKHHTSLLARRLFDTRLLVLFKLFNAVNHSQFICCEIRRTGTHGPTALLSTKPTEWNPCSYATCCCRLSNPGTGPNYTSSLTFRNDLWCYSSLSAPLLEAVVHKAPVKVVGEKDSSRRVFLSVRWVIQILFWGTRPFSSFACTWHHFRGYVGTCDGFLAQRTAKCCFESPS